MASCWQICCHKRGGDCWPPTSRHALSFTVTYPPSPILLFSRNLASIKWQCMPSHSLWPTHQVVLLGRRYKHGLKYNGITSRHALSFNVTCRLPGCSTGEKIQKWPKISRWAPPYQYVHQVVPHSKWGKGPKGSLTTCPLIHSDLSTAPCPLFSFNTLGLWLLHVKKWTFLCHWYYRVKFLVPFPIIKEWTFLCHFQLLKSELSCATPNY